MRALIPAPAAPPAAPATASSGGSGGTQRGILVLILAVMMLSGSDATSKFLSRTLPGTEIAWIRYLTFSVLVLLPMLRGRRGRATKRPAMQIARGLLTAGSAVFFIVGLRYLPLGEAAAMSYVSPVLITVLSALMLSEAIGPRRWAAVAVGMLGVLVVVRPGSAAFQLVAVYPLASALCWALAIILTRKLAPTDAPATTLRWSALSGLLALSLLQPLEFVVPTLREVLLGIQVGVLSSGGQWLIIVAYRHTAASTLAPFSYAQLLFSTLLGYLVFATVPDHFTIAGGVLIVASGLYTAHRERVRLREAAR